MPLVFISDGRCPVARAAAGYLVDAGYRVAVNGGAPLDGCECVSIALHDLGRLKSYFDTCGDLGGVIHPAPPPIVTSIEQADDDQWRDALSQGALASLLLTRVAGERMALMRRGSFIYLGDLHAEKPTGLSFLHSMGCAATQMLCREAAMDYGAKGVSFFYVSRGPMAHDLSNHSDLSNVYRGADIRYPGRRVPGPDSLNALIGFLLTDGARPLNGATLPADQGYTLYYGLQREGVDPT